MVQYRKQMLITILSAVVVILLAVVIYFSSQGNISKGVSNQKDNIDDINISSASKLFSTYGWSISGPLSCTESKLPDNLITNVEDSPMKYYWILAITLSGDIGLELDWYFGDEVTIEVYNANGEIPEKYNRKALSKTRGIVIRGGDGNIAGAFIDTATGVSYSLAGRDVEEITDMAFVDYWKRNYYEPQEPVNIAAINKTEEDVIRRFFQSVASGDDNMQLSTLSLDKKIHSLYSNLNHELPYNLEPELYSYLSGVEIISIEKLNLANKGGSCAYRVIIDANLSQNGQKILGEDRRLTRLVYVGKENGSYRIFSDNP